MGTVDFGLDLYGLPNLQFMVLIYSVITYNLAKYESIYITYNIVWIKLEMLSIIWRSKVKKIDHFGNT